MPDWIRGRAPLIGGLLLLAAGFLTAFLYPNGEETAAPAVFAAPNTFSGPLNGGCYLRTPVECNIHVDRWQPLTVDSGVAIDGFRIEAQRDGSNTFGNL